jgi:hypothetical protein
MTNENKVNWTIIWAQKARQMSQESGSIQEQTKELMDSTNGLENVASLGIDDFKLLVGDESVSCSRFELRSEFPFASNHGGALKRSHDPWV